MMHAVAMQYAPNDTQERVAVRAARVGERATDEAPFTWLRFEAADEDDARLRLNLWLGGEESELAVGTAMRSGIGACYAL